MRILNRKMIAETVAEAWKAQYPQLFGRNGEVYGQVVGASDPDEVDRIIGNKTWTSILCNECKEFVEEAISFDVDIYEDYPSREVCKSCLLKALGLIFQVD